MKHFIFNVAYLVLASMILLVGCSSSSLALPDNANLDILVSAIGSDLPGNHAILGAWDFKVNPDTLNIELSNNRTLATHLNATSLLSPPSCSDCIGIQVISADPVTHIYSINLTLRNPSTTIIAYDVRGTLLFPPTDRRSLVNADTYTGIFTGGSPCPFKAFSKSDPQRKFAPQASVVEQYDIYFPAPENFNVTLVIDASYPTNQEEPYAFSDTHIDGLIDEGNTSGAWLYTTVSDWQNNINNVSLKIGSSTVHMESAGNSVYKYYLRNSIGVPSGQYPVMIQALSQNSAYPLFYRIMVNVVLSSSLTYPIIDTSQDHCYNNTAQITCPSSGAAFFGQDSQYNGIQPSYKDNWDGTITDQNTGLMWQKSPDLDNKSTYPDAVAGAATFDLAGYDDWRLPTIKELYSLINFNGNVFILTPYIDTNYFDFRFGDESQGERVIDAQYWSSTEYVGTTMNGAATVFGVNFADGRIKGYPRDMGPGGQPMKEFVRYVRGNPTYGVNNFVDNEDGTVTDLATGLMWQKSDDGVTRNWQDALAYAESLSFAGHDDWRLPNAKELQSIVDYTRAPDASNPAMRGPAIDPIFTCTNTESFFWTSTTHLDGPMPTFAIYVSFGRAMGWMYIGGQYYYWNVHGAGAQRSDPKTGDPSDWPYGNGPQGDEVRIFNYVRCVRGGISG